MKLPLSLSLMLFAVAPCFGTQDAAPSAYREPAEFTVTPAVLQPDPGAFTATFNSLAGKPLVGEEYEPQAYRGRFFADGDGENVIVLSQITATGYNSIREGYYDGAIVRIYRIIDGRLKLIRTDKVRKHRASGWHDTLVDKLVSPDSPTFFIHFDGWNSPVSPYYFTVVAVAADGTRSKSSDVLDLKRPEKVDVKSTNTNLINFKMPEGGGKGQAPAAPTNFRAEVQPNGVVQFTWDPVPGAAGYMVLRSDYPPDQHHGYGMDLEGVAKSPAEYIHAGDLVFIDQHRDTYSRTELNSNRVWGDSASTSLPVVVPGYSGEKDGLMWRLVPHPGDVSQFPEENRGASCLELDMKNSDKQRLFKYCYASPAQEYYNTLDTGRTYVAEFWARQEGMSDPTVTFGATAIFEKEIHQDFTVTGEWKKYVYEFTPEKEFPVDNKIVGSMYLDFQGPGKLWVDAWRVYPKDAGYRQVDPRDVQALKESGMGFLRTHAYIKSGRSYFLEDLLGPNNRFPSLHSTLKFMKEGGTNPWIQLEMSLSEDEWLGFVEYMAAPYDPAKDTPQSKPWAYRRYQFGQKEPWTSVFPKILFEVSNEMWNPHPGFAPWHFPWQKMTDGSTGTVYESGQLAGLMTQYIVEQMKKSPYWSTLDPKMETVIGGWLAARGDNGFGQAAVKVAPVIKHNLIANYNGGWDEGATLAEAGDKGFRSALTVAPQRLGIAAREIAATRDRLAAQGVHYKIGTYEAGPGYGLPGTLSQDKVEIESQTMKSLAAGTATLDVFLDSATVGMGLQNFFTFSRGRDYWTSHARLNKGGQAYPSWLGLSLYNNHGQGELLVVQTDAVPTDDLAATKTRAALKAAPMVAVYATHEGDRVTVFALSRKLDNFPYPGDDGVTPLTLNLPFSKARKIILYKMDGDPRANNLDAENVKIESQEIPASAFSQKFVLDAARGAPKGGLPPAATYAYVFEGVDLPKSAAVQTTIKPAPGQSEVTDLPVVAYQVRFDRSVAQFPASAVKVLGTVGGEAQVTPVPDAAGTAYRVEIDNIEMPGKVRIAIPADAIAPGIPAAEITSPEITYALAQPKNELLAYEGFDYKEGDIWKSSGGSGWMGPWKLHNLNPENRTPNYRVSTDTPFTNVGVPVSPPYLQGGVPSMCVWRPLDVDGVFSRFSTDRPADGKKGYVIGKKGTTIWISALMRVDKENHITMDFTSDDFYKAKNGLAFTVGTIKDPGAQNQSYWGLRTRKDAKDLEAHLSAEPVTQETEMLMVVRVTFGKTDTVDLFINPDPKAADPGKPSVSTQAAAGLRFVFDKVVVWGGNYDCSSLDEIRIGDSYKAVVTGK